MTCRGSITQSKSAPPGSLVASAVDATAQAAANGRTLRSLAVLLVLFIDVPHNGDRVEEAKD
jgi:hypothetical protein